MCRNEPWKVIEAGRKLLDYREQFNDLLVVGLDATIEEFEASSIIVNGPRYVVVNGTADTASEGGGVGVAAGGVTERRSFGDVTMRLLATVADDGTEPVSYVPELVVRTTTWTYNPGTEIYELTDLDGNVYVMQSYAQHPR